MKSEREGSEREEGVKSEREWRGNIKWMRVRERGNLNTR